MDVVAISELVSRADREVSKDQPLNRLW